MVMHLCVINIITGVDVLHRCAAHTDGYTSTWYIYIL